MAQSIRHVLERRSDLSTFVVHLTRDSATSSAAENLTQIILQRRLKAASAFGWAKDQDDPDDPNRQSQRTVCFTEAPLEHLHTLVQEIQGRIVQMKPYGMAFTKRWARKAGINPILYVDMTPGGDWALKQAIESIVAAAFGEGFHDSAAAVLAPFVEQMGTWPSSQKEFWWEREWRHRGDLEFSADDVAVWLCPEDEITNFETILQNELGLHAPACIDPRWGLEHILLHLLGRDGDLVPPPA